MANEPIFLTVDEASSLKAAVESIVSMGINLQDTEHQIPAVKAVDVDVDGGTAMGLEVPPQDGP